MGLTAGSTETLSCKPSQKTDTSKPFLHPPYRHLTKCHIIPSNLAKFTYMLFLPHKHRFNSCSVHLVLALFPSSVSFQETNIFFPNQPSGDPKHGWSKDTFLQWHDHKAPDAPSAWWGRAAGQQWLAHTAHSPGWPPQVSGTTQQPSPATPCWGLWNHHVHS